MCLIECVCVWVLPAYNLLVIYQNLDGYPVDGLCYGPIGGHFVARVSIS